MLALLDLWAVDGDSRGCFIVVDDLDGQLNRHARSESLHQCRSSQGSLAQDNGASGHRAWQHWVVITGGQQSKGGTNAFAWLGKIKLTRNITACGRNLCGTDSRCQQSEKGNKGGGGGALNNSLTRELVMTQRKL